jgi:AraC-like DNA-binding protein
MQHLASDDVDGVMQVLRPQYEHSRVVHRRGPLGFRATWAQGHEVGLGWYQANLPQTLRGALDYTVIHLRPPQGTTYRVGRRTWTVASGDTVALLPQAWEYTRHIPAGMTFWLGLGRSLLDGEFSARMGPRQAGWRCGLQTLQLQDQTLATLTPALQAVVKALEPGAGSSHLAHARASLVSRVADCLLPSLKLTPQRDLQQARLQRLEAWVDANVEAPISLGTLCDLAGVGERSLQKAFESHRGLSPMRFVVERRLEAARRRLESGDAPGGVTRVAMDLGFDHLGRFASEYRALFGQSPSAALGRQRRRSDFGLPA